MKRKYLNITIWRTISTWEFMTKIKYLKTDGGANAQQAIWDHHVRDLFATTTHVTSVELVLNFLEVDTSVYARWESMDIIVNTVSFYSSLNNT